MATILERPRSVLSASPALTIHLRPEVIDVDLLDDPTPSTSSGPATRHAGMPEAVIMIDSDDDDFSLGEASRSGATRRAHRRQRLISPPPPAVAGPSRIPPVPPVPRRYSGFTSFPRYAPQPSPPVVRPIDRPFAFEAAMRASPPAAGPPAQYVHPNRHRRAQPPLQVPTLGLGGAIIALNHTQDRQNMRRERHRQLFHNVGAEPPGFLARAGHTMRRLYTTFARINDDDMDDDAAVQMMLANDLGGHFGPDRFEQAAQHAMEALHRIGGRDVPRGQEDDYKSEYTHPDPPMSGFTHDFAPPDPSTSTPRKPAPIVIDLADSDDDGPTAGPSSKPSPPSPAAQVHTLLVCARCLDPLVLGGALVGEEERRRKVWALRCGHLIDGKCLDIVGVPEAERNSVKGGIGTGKKVDLKGKGRAEADDEYVEFPSIPENNIRSRLRSRIPLPPVPNMGSSSTPASTSSATPPIKLGKRKRATKPRIEASHEWACPVANCGLAHVSVKMDSAWVPEPVGGSYASAKGKGKRPATLGNIASGRGAIAVFV